MRLRMRSHTHTCTDANTKCVRVCIVHVQVNIHFTFYNLLDEALNYAMANKIQLTERKCNKKRHGSKLVNGIFVIEFARLK